MSQSDYSSSSRISKSRTWSANPMGSVIEGKCLRDIDISYLQLSILHCRCNIFWEGINVKLESSCCDISAFAIFLRVAHSFYNKQNSRMSINDFAILAKVGEGAYSSVHKVKRISDGNVYALKKVKISNLNDKEKQNALNQVRLLASINSDNIIKYKEAFFDHKSNTLCIVMEFADGGDLEKMIEKKKKTMAWVDQKEIWTMMKQIMTGISVLHDLKIIHRDLKSANIFINAGIYKVADLNVSKLLKQELASTQTGTPYYASPEVWQDKPYEFKSDIWSFGCIIYQLCALKPPFQATSMQGLFKKVMKGLYPKIPTIYSQRLAKIIDSCLKIDPAKRPGAKQLLKMLEEGKEQIPKTRISSVNLLNTIKIPKNLQSWKNELPKADYDSFSQKGDEVYHPKFGNISQNKLKEIVRLKNGENNMVRKQTKKQLILQQPSTIRNVETSKPEKTNNEKGLNRRSQLVGLPRLKIYSEPAEHQRLNELLSKLKEEERRKFDYNRPTWWG